MTHTDVPEHFPEEDDDGFNEMDMLFYGVAALLVVIVFLAIFSLPYTYTSSRVWYSARDMANSSLSMGMIEEYRVEAEQNLGADYSVIFRSPEAETEVGQQRVGHRCLSGVDARTFVMPDRIHSAHGEATEYLMCAMTSGLQRLCKAENRERLAAQLIQFNDRRQNVYGVERVRDEVMQSRMARRMSRQMTRVANEIDGGGRVVSRNTKIDPEPDARITALVQDLSARGYLSATDFGYFGLVLPADYAPFLVPAVSAPSC